MTHWRPSEEFSNGVVWEDGGRAGERRCWRGWLEPPGTQTVRRVGEFGLVSLGSEDTSTHIKQARNACSHNEKWVGRQTWR